jgi:hypothetical protein
MRISKKLAAKMPHYTETELNTAIKSSVQALKAVI